MAHCLFRLYNEKHRDEDRFERVRAEMIPKLQAMPGFQRWAGLQTDDGRYGGFQVYDTRQEVEQAAQMFNEWRRGHGNDDPVDLEQRGETGLSILVRTDYEKGYGVVRIYRTSTSFTEVNEAIEHEGGETIRNLPGLLRYTTAKLDDGRIATFSAFETQQAGRDLTEKARELRSQAGSRLSKVLPSDPEVIEGRITFAVTKEPALQHT
jgi:heme-degrading monooxygenase HmoA